MDYRENSGPGGPIAAMLRDASWFPADVDFARDIMSFVYAAPETLAAQPFLDFRWQRDGLAQRDVPLAAVVAGMSVQPETPALNFIWHTSFCCSTLMARALNRTDTNLSLCEPVVLVHAADAKRAGRFARGGFAAGMPEVLFRLLARATRPATAVTVKPSNFANTLIAEALHLSQGRHLFLYSDLPSFLIAITRGGIHLHKYVRRLFTNIAGDSGERLPWTGGEILQLTDLELAALAWHLQMAEFRRGMALAGPGRAASLDCATFLADPRGVLMKLDTFFGLGLGPDHFEAVTGGPLFRQHAKKPGEAFDPEQRAREDAAIRARLGSNLDRVTAWSYRACPGTPAGQPLAHPLAQADVSAG